MAVFSFSFVATVFLFLCLGAMLYLYAETKGISIPKNTDDLYPILAMNHFGLVVALAFLLGITAAAYSSADSALTALTTSFCVDFLNFGDQTDAKSERIRKMVHLFFSVVIIIVILLFKVINNESVVVAVFKMAGYTYGPILGLFIFGIYSKRKVHDRFVPVVAFFAPIASYLIAANSEYLFNGYKFGFEVLILNGFITISGLFLISRKS
jgi:Na+/proline symporter